MRGGGEGLGSPPTTSIDELLPRLGSSSSPCWSGVVGSEAEAEAEVLLELRRGFRPV